MSSKAPVSPLPLPSKLFPGVEGKPLLLSKPPGVHVKVRKRRSGRIKVVVLNRHLTNFICERTADLVVAWRAIQIESSFNWLRARVPHARIPGLTPSCVHRLYYV